MTTPASALIVEVPESEGAIGSWRAEHDPVTAQGIPAHITVLYPFVPPDAFDEDVTRAVDEICRSVAPFEFVLDSIERFPDVVWLHPTPEDPFRALTAAIWSAFDDHPPYKGRFPDPQPHVTVGRVAARHQPEFVGRLSAEVVPLLPIRCRTDALSLFVDDGDDRWQRRHRWRFGPSA